MATLKQKTATTLKWNFVDRIGQQVLYAVTGIVLARELSQADFGLVGAVLIFQAFAQLLVDSGFSYALVQRSNPSRLDYSSVLWFNIAMAAVLYAALWAGAPLIADCFGGDARIVPLARVMFITFIINAAGIVQSNRFVKEMNVRPVALANTLGLTAGGVAGIWLAVSGYGAWAIVWQGVLGAAVRVAALWLMSRWLPLMAFSWKALRSFMSVGMGMMATSFLNTVFLNLYSFFIGNRVGLVSLGYYTQADKWSKMGIASLSQVLTSTTLPVLSEAQNDAPRFANMVRKFNRLTAYILLPAMVGLFVVSTPLFHTLFGAKWDASILLFRILLVRGIFTVLTGLYSNYLLALARAKLIVWMEVLRDSTAVIALIITWPYMTLSTPDDAVQGVAILLAGQLIASIVAWLGTLFCVARITKVGAGKYLVDILPYTIIAAVMALIVRSIEAVSLPDYAVLALQVAVGAAVYIGINQLLHSKIQADAWEYIRGRL